MAWAAALSRVGNIKIAIVLLVGGTCVYADVCVCALYTKAELRKDKALILVSSGLAFLPPSKEALNGSKALYAKRVNTIYKQADGDAMLWVRAETPPFPMPVARCHSGARFSPHFPMPVARCHSGARFAPHFPMPVARRLARSVPNSTRCK